MGLPKRTQEHSKHHPRPEKVGIEPGSSPRQAWNSPDGGCFPHLTNTNGPSDVLGTVQALGYNDPRLCL